MVAEDRSRRLLSASEVSSVIQWPASAHSITDYQAIALTDVDAVVGTTLERHRGVPAALP